MSGAITSAVDRVRQPEYTGENRCMACTATNLAIATVVAGVVALASIPVAVVVFSASVAAIGLRGYLVPGTPTLTRRYFPDWLLRLFDKPAVSPDQSAEAGLAESADLLAALGAIGECPDVDDLCLTDAFRESWHAEIEAVREGETDPADLAAAFLDLPRAPLETETNGDAGLTLAYLEDKVQARWRKRAAYRADVTAGAVLADVDPEWADRAVEERSQMAAALRLFLETCPDCDGHLTLGEETVESCCRSYDAAVMSCESCGTELLHEEITDPAD